MVLWKIDQSHSEIKFKVKHLVISSVTGQFKNFEGTVETNSNDFSDAKISFEADVNSIDTRNEQRDEHLKSADFFDSANYPKISFVSKSLSKESNNQYKLIGDLTIKSITKQVELDVDFNGVVQGFGGGDVAGFEISGKLNRFDYGLQWNALTEAGGIVVGEEVKIEISIELVKAA